PATLERHPRRPAASAAAAHAPAAPERPAPAGAQRHRTETLLLEQNYLLELIARGRPLDDCLRAITDSVTHLQPGMRAAVMLAGPGCTGIERVISARLPPDLTAELSKLPFDDPATPIPRKAVLLEGEAITVADIESDARWAGCWRAIWTAHGVKALHATPVCTVDGTITAAFFVCLAEARHPSPWERDLAQFGAHLASLVIERRRAEEAVRESEHKFRTLFESIDQGLCVLERVPDTARGRVDFRFLQANAGFTVQTGAGDLVGRTLREACPEEPEEAFLTYEHVLRSGESRKFERGQLDRGRVLELYAFRVDDGLQARLAVIVKDITERKRAEAFMLCQKRAFEQAASGMPLMEVLEFLARRTELHLGDKPRVAIHLLDPAGERFLRAAAPSLPADYCEGVSGVRRGAANDPCGVAVARGERLSVLAARHNQTFPGYAAFAARHGIESGWFLPISSSRGQALGVIACHYRDAREQPRDHLLSAILARTASIIIERSQVEEVLRQRSVQFQILVDQAPIGVFLLDGNLRVRQVNPSAQPAFGPSTDLVGRDYGELLRQARDPDYADQVLRTFRRTLATGESHHAVGQAIGLHGAPCEYYDWRVHRIPLPEGGYGVVCYFRDVSAETRARSALRQARDHLQSHVRERTEELEKAYKSLRVLSMRMMHMQDEDRRRISRELHDSAGQLLAALGMELTSLIRKAGPLSPELAEGIGGSLQLVQQLTQEIRTASYLLHPPLLDEVGLSSALRWYVVGLSKRSGIAITLKLDDGLGRLPRELEAALFHIVQESLTNIHRHSGSKTAMLRIDRMGGRLRLEIEDAGSGIPAEKLLEIQTLASGVGIAGMRERVQHFNGDMRITSMNPGTRIAVSFPIEPASELSEPLVLSS
ncbi:MAG: PAS domain-containing protein, partial [Gammaproteobacteria bacterium]|nr:PAS domain-containing protein [Gammaproteobacteria bacterium]